MDGALRRATIVALASGAPPAALAIIRISGPDTRAICAQILRSGLPPVRRATLTHFSDDDGHLIDTGLAVFMAGPQSYTGEDTLELTLHGGAAVIEHALTALTAHPNVRMAEPGEFTRRAFEAGKLDLTEAEGIADLIEAETVGQKAQALRQIDGGLSQVFEAWRQELTALLALIEVAVDFPDEADAPTNTDGPVAQTLATMIADFERALGDHGIGERIRDGFRVAIIGAPNAGKSTLLNRLAGRDAAIVTPLPGTTRDVIEVRRILGGQIVWFADTAGLRETTDTIEIEGIARARRAASQADLRLHLIAADQPGATFDTTLFKPGDFIVFNKTDLDASLPGVSIEATHRISSATGDGIAALEADIASRIANHAGKVEAPLITRLRHRARLTAGHAALVSAHDALNERRGAEFVAEDVRLATRELASLLGTIQTEDVLGAVFSRFCIGK